MLKFSRLLLGLTLAGLVSLPSVAALPGGLSNTSTSSQAGAVQAEGLSLVPPAGWTAQKASGKNIMSYLAPVENNFRANFNVTLTDDDGTTAQELSDMLHPVYAKQFQKWKAMSEGVIKLAGVDAYFISSSFTMQGLNIQNLQYFFPGKNKRYYILTFTSLASFYPKYEKVFKQTAASAMISAN